MGISLKTHKMLWGKSGGICAFPDCNEHLFYDETETDDDTLIGEEAHIVAKKKDGPRGGSDLDYDKRDLYDNLILLCGKHHKVIDDSPQSFTVEKLKEMKRDHEMRVSSSLDIDEYKDEIIYATYCDKLLEIIDADNWAAWTSGLFAMPPYLMKEKLNLLKEAQEYIIRRVWPIRFEPLKASFYNFKNIANDLTRVFETYMERSPYEASDSIYVEKIYKGHYRDKNLEQKLLNKYKLIVDILSDLMVELTRALNYICDKVREFIHRGFRLEEGNFIIETGGFFKCTKIVVKYNKEQRNNFPYQGIEDFFRNISNRDFHYVKNLDGDLFEEILSAI